jgi:hypothetical protein
VRPAREHDTTALRAHAEALPLLAESTDDDHAVLGDLGYEGEQATPSIPIQRAASRMRTGCAAPHLTLINLVRTPRSADHREGVS